MRLGHGIKRRRRVVTGVHSGSKSVASSKLGSSSRFWKTTKRPALDPSAYSTVTDFARLRGWSTSVPMMTAV
ncbi:hypothetical protein ACVWZV_005934 [Bradyrhizobium sp. GM5.1]